MRSRARHFSRLVMLFDAILAAAQFELGAPRVQVGDLVLHRPGFLAFFQTDHCVSTVKRDGAAGCIALLARPPSGRTCCLFAPALRGTARTDLSVICRDSNPRSTELM